MSTFNSGSRKGQSYRLQLEQLEDRMMLSTVEIFAAGATGQENLDLFIDDQYVTTFLNVGGNVDQRDFVQLTYQTDEPLTPGRVSVAFGNDFFDPQTGFDRNLLVDRIVVEGVEAQTEAASTFSTGIYQNGATGPGFFQTELLNINSIFTYADPVVTGDRVQIDAVGSTGQEILELVINDQVVQYFGFVSAGTTHTFTFDTADPNLSIDDIRIQFSNDLFDPAAGIDRNVQIFEFRVIDGATGNTEIARTSDGNVLSSGIFVDGVGITSGLGAGGYLAGNGFVEVVGDADQVDSGPVRLQLNEEVFDRENPGLVFEDFEGLVLESDLPPSFNQNFTLPLTSETNNLQVQPGDIVDGVAFQPDPNREVRINNTNSGISQFPSAVLGTPSAGDLSIDFEPGVRSVGFDLFAVDNSAAFQLFSSGDTVVSNTNATVQVFGNSGLIDEVLVSAPQPNGFDVNSVFVGLEVTEDITGLVIQPRFTEPNPGGGFATGASFALDNVRFG